MHATRLLLSMFIAAFCVVAFARSSPVGSQEPSDKIVSRIPHEPVSSSAIAFVGYSKRLQILEIEFINGAVYRYTAVPRSVYHKLMAAQSKAHYYDQNIRGNYKSFRIRKWQKQEAQN